MAKASRLAASSKQSTCQSNLPTRRAPNPNDSYASAAAPEGMSALVDGQRAASDEALANIGNLELDDNNIHSDDGSAPLSPATDDEEPLSPCGSDNGLLASSEGEIRIGPSITRPTAVEPTSTPPPPPILTDLDAPTCVICLEALGDDSSDNPGVAARPRVLKSWAVSRHRDASAPGSCRC